MRLHRIGLLLCVLFLFNALTAFSYEQTMKGAAKIKLTGAITQEQMDQCREDAKDRLKPEMLMWLEDVKNVRIDTNDVLTNLFFDMFLDSSITRAKETSAFIEKYWTVTYIMLPQAIEASMQAFNDRIELLAVHAWKRLENAKAEQNFEEVYYQSVEAIAYASAYMGKPLTVPNDSNKILVEEGRQSLKNFMERLSLTTNNQLLEGKPGHTPQNPPTITVTIDGRPFAGLGLTGYIPGGANLFNGVADNTGIISLETFMLPFVKNGSMMYLSPNLGMVINSKWRVGLKDFGLNIKKDLNLTFFYKIIRPTFSLTYETTNNNKEKALPADIASGSSLKKYFIDSCHFVPSTDGKPDLIIAVKYNIFSAGSSFEEVCEARMNATISIRAPGLTPPRNEDISVDYERKYEKMNDPPIGSFLWEANTKLHKAIQKIVSRL